MDMIKRYLDEREQRALLMAAKGSNDPLAQRDYLWMRLMVETGARVSELASFTALQAERALAFGWLVVAPAQRKANSKGQRKGHSYLVTEPVRHCLVELLKLQRMQASPLDAVVEPPLIWGRQGAGLSVRSYQARIAEWAAVAGLQLKVSPHWLRHTRGVNIIRRSRATNPVKVAQLALGHATIASTGIYTQMSRQEYVQALQATAGGRTPRRVAEQLAAELEQLGGK
jgi:site-specific recombinase XerC